MIASKTTIEVTAEEEQEAREDIQHYADLVEYLDTHDTGDDIVGMPEVHFEINLPPRKVHFAIEAALAVRLRETASQRGVSAETLLNEWVREKAAESEIVGTAK